MSKIPEDLRYTKEHEWVKVEGELVRVGITDYAQEKLGEVVFVELPEVGNKFTAMAAMGTVESVKAVSEVYAPVAGEIVEVNQAVVNEPALLNRSPYEEGWLVKIRPEDPGQVDSLLTAEKYADLIKE